MQRLTVFILYLKFTQDIHLPLKDTDTKFQMESFSVLLRELHGSICLFPHVIICLIGPVRVKRGNGIAEAENGKMRKKG